MCVVNNIRAAGEIFAPVGGLVSRNDRLSLLFVIDSLRTGRPASGRARYGGRNGDADLRRRSAAISAIAPPLFTGSANRLYSCEQRSESDRAATGSVAVVYCALRPRLCRSACAASAAMAIQVIGSKYAAESNQRGAESRGVVPAQLGGGGKQRRTGSCNWTANKRLRLPIGFGGGGGGISNGGISGV